MRAILLAGILLMPAAASAERVRRDLTLDIVPLGLGARVDPRPRIVYKLFPGVDPSEARARRGIPFLPILRISMDEGPVLQTMVWSGTGAMVGTLFGPGGTVIGAAVGGACGFVIGCLYNPKTQSFR